MLSLKHCRGCLRRSLVGWIYGSLVAVDVKEGTYASLGSLGGGYHYPFGIVLDKKRNRILVVAMGWMHDGSEWVLRSALRVYDLNEGKFTDTLVLGDKLFSIDVALHENILYVANTDDNSVQCSPPEL